MSKMKVVGIYKILNIKNNKCYVGSSINIKDRWSKHKQHLNKQKHHNFHLQKSWSLNGAENFIFEIIEQYDNAITSEFLDCRETYWINFYKSDNEEFGYNLYHYSRKPLNYKYSSEVIEKRKERIKKNGHSWLGKKHTKETKIKMSNSHTGKKMLDSTKEKLSVLHRGIKLKTETIEKMKIATKGENNPRALLNKEDVIYIRQLYKLGYKICTIAKLFEISWSAIGSIVKYKTWKNL